MGGPPQEIYVEAQQSPYPILLSGLYIQHLGFVLTYPTLSLKSLVAAVSLFPRGGIRVQPPTPSAAGYLAAARAGHVWLPPAAVYARWGLLT